MTEFIESLPVKHWKGFRLIAGDGTSINIPVSKNTISHFGLYKNSTTGGKTVLANACMLYDVLSELALSSKIAPYKEDEKTIMCNLIDTTTLSNTIAIFDRGFSCFYFIKKLISNNLDFCIRIKTKGLSIATQILNNPLNDFIIEWHPTDEEKITAKRKGQNILPIKIRATKIILPSGETEILISSLYDTESITTKDMGDLYHLRWNVEEGYKKLKPKMKLEQFGCKKADGIYQEFYSHIFMMNLTTLLGCLAQKAISNKAKNRKYQYKYNWSNAYKFLKGHWLQIYLHKNIICVINKIIQLIEKSVIAVIPNRSFNRCSSGSSRKHRPSPIYK